MRLEKIFKRDDGTRIKIDVYFFTHRGKFDYIVKVLKCQKNKRKFLNIMELDGRKDSEYRALNMEDSRMYTAKWQLEYASVDEIQSAKIELWNALKP